MKRRLCMLIAGIGFISFRAAAQPQQPGAPGQPPSQEERLKHVSEKMEKDLKLSAAQKDKLTAAYKDFFTAIESERAKSGKKEPPPPPPPPVAREVAEKLSKTRDEKIKAILSADQFKKYTEIEKTMRPPLPPGKPGEGRQQAPEKKQ